MNDMVKKIIATAPTIMTQTSLSESFFEAVLKRLVSFGYVPKESDGWVISFATLKVENHIKNSCNTTDIPDGLIHTAVDMVCGEFLFTKKQTGKLELADLDLNGAITSISEGDISISFDADSSDEDKFNSLLNYLLHEGEGDFVCYRKLKW